MPPASILVNCSLQTPVTLLVTQSNSDNDEDGWHKDNNSDCEYQVDDDKAATQLVTKSNSDKDENGWHKDNNTTATIRLTATRSCSSVWHPG